MMIPIGFALAALYWVMNYFFQFPPPINGIVVFLTMFLVIGFLPRRQNV